ncbi:VOC family protein [Klugiella xanthotipulae]|uniref:VOC domain-containing protein n=1 Tax=Klugiella xanthotipulae TaxID=244735 RepID=A0A543HTD7_9MICO|nr:VOC family protein [Klugiella xanthotipulae]TQM61550.1 hypothetical protein FB466_2507 [Klugiella xanthotipulae]
MVTFTQTMTGEPIWMDLFSSNPEASMLFYQKLFGWTSEAAGPDFNGYVTFSLHGERVAGLATNDTGGEVADAWTVYLHTADAETTAALIEENGGGVHSSHRVGSLGTMLILNDANGAVLGAWQPGTHTGFGVYREPGAPAWIELHTTGYAGALTFYQRAFGWETTVMGDSDEFRYSTLGSGESSTAGMMDATSFLPPGARSTWVVYFAVADADQAVALAVERGGRVLRPVEDTPFGRMAELVDPTGAPFKVLQDTVTAP